MSKLTDVLGGALASALSGLHTNNGAEITQAVEALIDGRLLHLQGSLDRLTDQVSALRAEIEELKKLKVSRGSKDT